jgi:hypothetical protein
MMKDQEIRKGWEGFIEKGTVSKALRPVVVASWQRSQSHGIPVSRNEAPLSPEVELTQCRSAHSGLLEAARPVLNQACLFLADANSMIILTDSSGVVLETAGDPRAIDFGQMIHLEQGGRWQEADIGTNAIGTAIAEAKPVQIHGLTGARFISKDLGARLEDVRLEDLGTALQVRASQEATTITGGGGDPAKIRGRRAQIQKQLEIMEQPVERDKLQERLGRMSGAIAIIRAGGATPVEQKRSAQMIEDALNAARAATEEGVLAAQTLIVDKPESVDPTSEPCRGGGAERYGMDYSMQEVN